MTVIPVDTLRENYNEISEFCKRSREPVYLSRNGESNLVVMDIEAFAKRESMLRLREHLVAAEENRLSSEKGYSIEDVSIVMKNVTREASREEIQPLSDKHQR
jgi:PHD/YefM family antitoxin component YafN of YafNO toxin-antitoxin module